jgi:hypothetical protein
VKFVLPPTVFTVNVTEIVRFRIPDLLTTHGVGVVEQVELPDAPLLQVPVAVVEIDAPSRVTEMVTRAVHFEPFVTLEGVNATVVTEDGLTERDVVAVAPSSSVVIRVTV